ncbi:MAG: hypothetical protein R3A52_17105 [Polyangiales bacterium]
MTVEFRFEGEAAAPRDAATVLVLRDGPSRVEVFFVKRDAAARFMGGAYVFPGGRLDPGDADPSVPCDLTPEAAAARWPGHDPLTARALHVAALREALEESGLLLCDPAPSVDDVAALRAPRAARVSALRPAPLLPRAHPPRDGPAPVVALGHPKQESRRFDSRFFVAAAPPDLAALTHDGSETVDSAWLSPADAIERAARRRSCSRRPRGAPSPTLPRAHRHRSPRARAARPLAHRARGGAPRRRAHRAPPRRRCAPRVHASRERSFQLPDALHVPRRRVAPWGVTAAVCAR